MKAARGLLSAIATSVDEVSPFHSHTEQRPVTWLIVGNPSLIGKVRFARDPGTMRPRNARLFQLAVKQNRLSGSCPISVNLHIRLVITARYRQVLLVRKYSPCVGGND